METLLAPGQIIGDHSQGGLAGGPGWTEMVRSKPQLRSPQNVVNTVRTRL